MSQAAPVDPDEHTSMQLDDGAAQQPASAAAAVLVALTHAALPQPADAAAAGPWTIAG